MAPHNEANLAEMLLQLLSDRQHDNEGVDYFAAALRLVLNEAMKIERTQVLGAAPYERTEERRGYVRPGGTRVQA